MFNLVNSAFNRTYNPNGKQNALTYIKRLLTSRNKTAQIEACNNLTKFLNNCNANSNEQIILAEYLLNNDITVFLCGATTNLEFDLFRSILNCLRMLWRSHRFFSEEHATQTMSAVVQALTHYAGSGNHMAVESCLNFLDDLLNGVRTSKTVPPLSEQSGFSVVQLLSCLNSLLPGITANPKIIISTALVLQALISYQPDNLIIRSNTANALGEVLKRFFTLLMGVLNQSIFMNCQFSGMFYAVACGLGKYVLSIVKLLTKGQQKCNFVQSILVDDQEIKMLNECAKAMDNSVQQLLSELVVFTKEYISQIPSEEYGDFLKLLLTYFYNNVNTKALSEFGELLFSKGYLTMLPQVQIARNDVSIRKASTRILGEMVKVLSEKYLNINNLETENCAKDLNMGLHELEYAIKTPQDIGSQLLKGNSYTVLIYVYFYCQSSENPGEITDPLLPFLMDYVLRIPRTFRPPSYVVKALWLVFAMSVISNGGLESLDKRVYLEKATEFIIAMLQPEPAVYYTHNPAILLWSFTSQRIPNYIRALVLSEWLKTEDPLPAELTNRPIVWELLFNIVIQNTDTTLVVNCMDALRMCLNEDDQDRQQFSCLVWNMLPTILSNALVEEHQIGTNICHILELATTLVSLEIDQTTYLKTAVLITALFSKNNLKYSGEFTTRHDYENACLKTSIYLLVMTSNQNDNRVLLTYTNRVGFLPSVLFATNSMDDRVACAALQLLSYITYYFTKNNYQPRTVVQIDTNMVIQSLRKDSLCARSASLMQLVYMVLSTGANTPLALTYQLDEEPTEMRQYNALRALMFRIQVTLCGRENQNQSAPGWKTLNAIFTHALTAKNDSKLVTTLTSQPWTHILIQFQLTQNITQEFLIFLYNWLNLLRISINISQKVKKLQMDRRSIIIKTMFILKKNLTVDEDLTELNQKVLNTVKEILDESGIRIDY